MSNKSEVVHESLRSFGALRTGLAYFRSISIIFEDDEQTRRSAMSREIKTMTPQGAEDEADSLEDCYHRATISMYIALVYVVLTHYRKLGGLNSRLKHAELDHAVEVAASCGLLEKMRQVRNSVFHVRPGTKMETLVEEVTRLAIDNGIELAALEDLLYDFTVRVFSSTEIFQESEEELMKSFNDALAYYDEHLA